MSETLRYPLGSVGPDYARALVGLAFTAGPLLFVPAAPVVAVVLGVMAGLFALFAARTALRHATTFVLDDAGIGSTGPLPRRVSWASLASLKLSYYATRRDRTKGWMHLRLRDDHGSLTVDSGIERFPEIVRLAYGAASRRGVQFSGTTLANLAAMGITINQGGEAQRP